MRVFIVDDHPVLRLGLRNMLQAEPDIVVCGEATGEPGALAGIVDTSPDVALVDITLKEGDGLSLIQSLSQLYPKLRILVVSMHDENEVAARALQAGAHGYVMKSRAAERVVEGVRAVTRGELFVSAEFASRILNQFVVGGGEPPGGARLDTLSERETSIYLLIGEGKSTREIADALGLHVKTIETHRSRIRLKLGLLDGKSLVQSATAWAQSEAGRARRAAEGGLTSEGLAGRRPR